MMVCALLASVEIIRHNEMICCISQYASNTQGREEGEIEVKDGQSYEVSGQIGKWQPDLNRTSWYGTRCRTVFS